MKNIIRNSLLLIMLTTTNIHATVRTLNNNNPSPGQYTTWEAVQNASSPNDTIYVSGSPQNYGHITVDKYGLTLIGTGFNPGKQNPLISEFGAISGDVGMIRLIGIKCRSIELTTSIGGIPVPGEITYYIEYCKILYVLAVTNYGSNINLFLHNNILGHPFTPLILSGIWAGFAYSNVGYGQGHLTGDISNNIIYDALKVGANSGNGTSTPLYFAPKIKDCYISNNIFVKKNVEELFGNFNFSIIFTGATFSNNILIGWEQHGLDSNLSTVQCKNNLIYPYSYYYTMSMPNSSNTIYGNPQFVNYPCPTWDCAYDTSYDYHLSSTSPGKNAGTDGSDIGPYGGMYALTFNTSGEPHIPQVKEMNMPRTLKLGQSFTTNIVATEK